MLYVLQNVLTEYGKWFEEKLHESLLCVFALKKTCVIFVLFFYLVLRIVSLMCTPVYFNMAEHFHYV